MTIRPRFLVPGIGVTVAALAAVSLAAKPDGTLSFAEPVPLPAGDGPMAVAGHAATRCVDWEDDGDLDLLVGGGDGKVWLFRNQGRAGRPAFAGAVAVAAGGRDRWGTGLTGSLLANLVGDELPDLVVGHSNDQVAIHRNTGTATAPVFAEEPLTLRVQDGCHGRIDVADWDGDGQPDLVAGAFGGGLRWYRNLGGEEVPRFAEGQPLAGISMAYNSHPRWIDLDSDGLIDLLVGVNWGTVTAFHNSGTPREPRLGGGRQLQRAADGGTLALRELQGDDTTPDLADLDGDDVLDLVSGGGKGRVVMLPGVGTDARVASLRAALAEHGDELAAAIGRDEALRAEVFGSLLAMQADLELGIVPADRRAQLSGHLTAIAREFPRVFGRRRFDLEATPFAGPLAAQFWVVVVEASPATTEAREEVADAIGFTGGHRRVLVDLGVIFVDNDTAPPEQIAAMHRLMTALPRVAWDVETVTVADWLGEAARQQPLRARAGVNIFALPLGRTENSFPADAARPGVTDVFLICLAHELAHNMLDTVGRRTRPDLYERKFAILERAAGPLVAYRTPKSAGIDQDATRARFRAAGAWDGDQTTWSDAWKRHFDGQEAFDRSTCRGNVRFFLESPQEAFATLANQYVADSRLMLEFAKARWDAGYRANADQFLLIAEYLSGGRDRVECYVLRPGGTLVVTEASVERDERGRIRRLRAGDATATFGYGGDDLVERFDLEQDRGAS
jgi:hypothetical protein